MMTVKVGDTIGLVQKVLYDNKGRENYWKLTTGKVKSITINSKGRRVKAEHFYTLGAEEIEMNTQWLQESTTIMLTCEPFILTDELLERATTWIDRKNELEGNGA